MPVDLPPPPMSFWNWAGRTVTSVIAWLLLMVVLRLTRAGLALSRYGFRVMWTFRLASAALDAATWMRPDLAAVLPKQTRQRRS